MSWISELRFRLNSLRMKRKAEAEMADEIRDHLELRIERNIAAGMTPEEAHSAAQRHFGGVDQIKERCRDARGWVWLEQWLQDIRHACRQIRRHPGFSLAVVLMLGLGIGINTAIFGLVDALLLRPLPIADPDNLWSISIVDIRDGRQIRQQSYFEHYENYQKNARSLSSLIAYAHIPPSMVNGELQASSNGQLVSDNYFEALGVKPALGRISINGGSGEQPSVVISHRYWQEHFGSDDAVVGRTLTVSGHSFIIAGVAAAGFTGLNAQVIPDFWMPASWVSETRRSADSQGSGQSSGSRRGTVRLSTFRANYQLFGRIAAGFNREQTEQEMQVLVARSREGQSGTSAGLRSQLVPAGRGSWSPLRSDRIQVARVGMLVMSAVALVLLIACANAANLLIARAFIRRREIAVRLALGASRGRIIRQLLTESVVLALLGGGAGLIIAHWGIAGLLSLRAGWLASIPVDAHLDSRMLAFTFGAAALTGILSGLLPAHASLRFDLSPSLKNDLGGNASRRSSFAVGNLLIVGQVAVCLLLLTGAGLSLRSLAKLATMDAGFDPSNTLIATIALNRSGGPSGRTSFVSIGGAPGPHGELNLAYVDALMERFADMPGVRDVSIADTLLPLSGNYVAGTTKELEGYERQPDERIQFGFSRVGPGYFRLIGFPLLIGRDLSREDRGTARPVIVVNESFVQHYWPGQNPLGRMIDGAEIIGVVRDGRIRNLREEPAPHVYQAALQHNLSRFTLLLKADGPADRFVPIVEQEAAALDSASEVTGTKTMRALWWDSLARDRLLLSVLMAAAIVAVVFAFFGLYAVVAYSVVRRTREIGIHMALGAEHRDVVRAQLVRGMRPVIAGTVLGLTGAVSATRILQAMLYDVSPTDGLTFVAVSILMIAAGLFACWLPARRAAKVDPIIALRAE